MLAGCSESNDSFLDPQGPLASAQRAHFIRVLLWSMLAAGPVLVLTPLILWRYRYRNRNARYTPRWDFSLRIEMLAWGIPFLIVSVLSYQLWESTHALDPYKPIESTLPALEVQVIGLDWKWLFIYPDQRVATVGELAFPVDRPVSLVLTSDTVMQSFLVSALAGQIYVMPGMQTRLQLKADAPGVFEGENTQFNGAQFPAQKFEAIAMQPDAFERWVGTVQGDGVPLTRAVYRELGIRSTPAEVHASFGSEAMPARVTYFQSALPDLYADVMQRYRAGAAVRPEDQPGGAAFQLVGDDPEARPAPGGSAR